MFPTGKNIMVKMSNVTISKCVKTISKPDPKFEQPTLAEMAQLARQLKMQNMTRERILDKVIRDKMENISILEGEEMCWLKQIRSKSLADVFSKLIDKEEMEEPVVTEEDIK